MEIKELRQEIDKIDDEILELLNKRKEIIKDITVLKKELNEPIYDKDRERQLLEKLKIKSKEKDLDENFVSSIYEIILKNSKEEQKKL